MKYLMFIVIALMLSGCASSIARVVSKHVYPQDCVTVSECKEIYGL